MEFLFLFKILEQKIVLLCTLYYNDDVINFDVQLYIIILLNYIKISFFSDLSFPSYYVTQVVKQ